MAKKKKLDDHDDWLGFDDFNFDDMGFDSQPIKDDRTPVSKIAGSFTKGMKDKAHNRDFQKQMLRRALPKEYESGFDAYDEVSSFFRELNEGIKRELRPGLREIRELGRKIFPGKPAFVPEGLYNKVTDYLDEDQGIVTKHSQEKEDNAKIGIMLGEIFAEQAKYDEAKTRDSMVREEIRNVTERKRFEGSYKEQVRTNSLLTNIVNYQDKVTTAYRKRVLELQYKSYLVQARTLETLKTTNEETNALLKSVVKNTGLPDYVKLRSTEAVKELMRRRLINAVMDGSSSTINGLFGRVLGAGATGIIGAAKNFGSQLAMAASIAGMSDDGEDGELTTQEKLMKAGMFGSEMAGGEITAKYAGMLADKARGWFGRGDEKSLRRKVLKAGKAVDYYAGNRDQHMQNILRDDNSVIGGVLRLFGLDEYAHKNDSSLTRKLTGIDALGGPGGSEKQRLTIEEVIPGWLSRIYGELRMTRTGEDSYEPEAYDFKHRKFVTSGYSANKIAAEMFDRNKNEYINKIVDKLAKEMLGGATVSQEAMTALTRRIKMDALEARTPSPEAYRFNIGPGVSEKAQTEIREAIEKTYGYDFAEDKFIMNEDTRDKRNSLFKRSGNIQNHITFAKNYALQAMDEGHIQGLRDLGLIKETTDGLDFDYNRYFEMVENGVDLSSVKIPPIPPHEMSRAKRRRQRRGKGGAVNIMSADQPVYSAQQQPNMAQSAPHIADTRLLDETIGIRAQGLVQIEILKEILQKMYAGIPSAGQIPADGDPGASKPFVLDFNNMARRVGKIGESIYGVAKKVVKGTFWAPTTLLGKAPTAARGMLIFAKETAGIANKNILQPIRERLNKLTDVYIGEETMPRLTFDGFMAKRYIDKTTGKVITKLEDLKNVKEAIVDASDPKKVIVTAEEISKGLKDRYGKKLTTMRSGIIRKTKEAVGSAVGMFGSAFDAIRDGLSSDGFKDFQSSVFKSGARGVRGISDLIGRITGGVPDMISSAGRAIKGIGKGALGMMGFGAPAILERIYTLLDRRMPGAPGSHLSDMGDIDGDGIRDNSWQDRIRRREERKEKEAAEGGAGKGKAAGKNGGMLAGLLSMLGLGKNNEDDDADSDEEGGIGLGDVADAAIIKDALSGDKKGGRKNRGGKKGGFWKNFKKKPVRTALGAGLSAGRTVLGTALSLKPAMVVGKGLLMGAGLLGKGALLLAMNPITLAAIGAGTAAYMGYKWFKKNQNFKKNYMTQLRAMHYGFDHTDEDQVARMLELERQCAPRFKRPGEMNPFDEPSSLEELQQFFAALGTDFSNNYHKAIVAEWWERRGGPIMAKWFNEFYSETEAVNLEGLDKGEVSPVVSFNLLKRLNIPYDNPESPINFPMHPMNGDENEAPIGETVAEFYEKVVERAKDHKKEQKKEMNAKQKHAEMKEKIKARREAAAKRMNERLGKKEPKQTDPMMGVLLAGRAETKAKEKDYIKNMMEIFDNTIAGDYSKKWVWPVKDGKITSMFGMRTHPVYGTQKPHNGVDIAAPEGTPIMAAQSGTVRVKGYLKGYGNSVYIEHDNGTHSRYAHMAAFADDIEVGSRVHAGQVIGFVGNTGVGTGPHLHFEIRNGTNLDNSVAAIDPVQYIKDSNVAAQRKEAEQRERAVAQGGEDLLNPESAFMEGTDTIGVGKRKDFIPADVPLMFTDAAMKAAKATGKPIGNNTSTIPAAVASEVKATLDTEDLLGVGVQQVEGIHGVAKGVGTMTDEQRRTNEELQKLNAYMARQNKEPTFRVVNSATGNNTKPQPAPVPYNISGVPADNPPPNRNTGSSSRVAVAQNTRNSASSRSM